MTVRRRVLAALLRMARELTPTGDQVTLAPAPSLSELAGRVSTHREAVSREISRLVQLGILQRGGGSLRALSISRLVDVGAGA